MFVLCICWALRVQDYRMHNLKESGEQLQQTLLQNMPKGKALMKELVKLAEVGACLLW